ncbi:hypothetical protein DID88_003951 [Monilinia fructigena]|uniref:Carboxylic ester hydrolase n=1 Tax=Monilinia fructigena TaxID=38457 RepID=A0A395IEJ9_9HELO|nr:hypothetical protein DID88_003951 [Monilinia fructigena]
MQVFLINVFCCTGFKTILLSFGGNPDHVVIHGDSAGGGSVALHLTAYGGRDENSSLVQLENPLSFQHNLQHQNWNGNLTVLQMQPAADWQDYPYALFDQGLFVNVPIMFGDVTNEGSVFAPNAASPNDISTFLKNNYPYLSLADTVTINNQYPLQTPLPNHAPYFPSASAAYGETTFTCPAIMISIALTYWNDASQVWHYRYNVQDTNNIASGLGVPHVFELPAIFGPGNANEGSTSYKTYNKNIVPVVMEYWISFVRFLSPNPGKDASAPHWPTMGTSSAAGGTLRRLVLQTNASVTENIPDDQLARCIFWKGLAVKMGQ